MRKREKMEDVSRTKKHWLVFGAISFMYMASLGLVNNTIGVYYTPVSESLQILTGTFAMNATISAIFTAIGGLFSFRVVERIGLKKTLTLGAISCFVGMFGMGLTNSVAIFNVLGMIRGIGVGFTATVPGVAVLNNWFDEKNGLTISLAAASGGIVSVIFSPVFNRLIEMIGWEKTFLVHGIIILLLFLPSVLLPFTYEPQDEGLLPYGSKAAQTKENKKETRLKAVVNKDDFIGKTFYAFIAMAFVQTFIVGLGQHLPGYGTSLGFRLEVTGLMLSAAMLGNVSTKLIAGFLSDKVGVLKTTILTVVTNIASILLLIYLANESGLLFAALLFGTVYAGGVTHVLLAQYFFGLCVGNYVNAYVVFAAGGSSALGNALIGYFYDYFGTYLPIFWLLILLQVVGLFLLGYAVKAMKEKEVREGISVTITNE